MGQCIWKVIGLVGSMIQSLSNCDTNINSWYQYKIKYKFDILLKL